MAKLKNKEKIWTAKPGESVTVGNNRTVTYESGGVYSCRLHGHAVATIEPKGATGIAYVSLDTCGYLTATTISAMDDFLSAFGVTARASRAGGQLSVRWKMPAGAWRDKASDSGVLTFTGHRYV